MGLAPWYNRVKAPLGYQCSKRTTARGSAAPLRIQLPVNGLGEQQRMVHVLGHLYPCGGPRNISRIPALERCTSGSCGHLNQKMEELVAVFPSFCVKTDFQMKLHKKINKQKEACCKTWSSQCVELPPLCLRSEAHSHAGAGQAAKGVTGKGRNRCPHHTT